MKCFITQATIDTCKCTDCALTRLKDDVRELTNNSLEELFSGVTGVLEHVNVLMGKIVKEIEEEYGE